MATGESSDSKVKQTTVIGGHVKKKEGESSVVAPHMAIQPMNMPVSGWPNPLQVDAEVSNTMGEIQDIQAQLSKLMANKPSAVKPHHTPLKYANPSNPCLPICPQILLPSSATLVHSNLLRNLFPQLTPSIFLSCYCSTGFPSWKFQVLNEKSKKTETEF